jgi:GR25 family glycosyltransferase involved in LPS biosynthesis
MNLNPLRHLKQHILRGFRSRFLKHSLFAQLKTILDPTLRNTHIFCINLPRDKQKRQHISNQCKRLGLKNLSFVTAVDGVNIGRKRFLEDGLYDPQLALRYEGAPLSDAAIALSLTHSKVWKEIAESNLSHAIVIEDDAIFINRVISSLDVNNLCSLFDLVFLDAYLDQKPPRGQVGNFLYTSDSYKGCTGGYLLTKQGAKNLALASIAPICHPVDGFLGWYNRHASENEKPWCDLNLSHISQGIYFPRPILNGSILGYWPSAISNHLPDY